MKMTEYNLTLEQINSIRSVLKINGDFNISITKNKGTLKKILYFDEELKYRINKLPTELITKIREYVIEDGECNISDLVTYKDHTKLLRILELKPAFAGIIKVLETIPNIITLYDESRMQMQLKLLSENIIHIPKKAMISLYTLWDFEYRGCYDILPAEISKDFQTTCESGFYKFNFGDRYREGYVFDFVHINKEFITDAPDWHLSYHTRGFDVTSKSVKYNNYKSDITDTDDMFISTIEIKWDEYTNEIKFLDYESMKLIIDISKSKIIGVRLKNNAPGDYHGLKCYGLNKKLYVPGPSDEYPVCDKRSRANLYNGNGILFTASVEDYVWARVEIKYYSNTDFPDYEKFYKNINSESYTDCEDSDSN